MKACGLLNFGLGLGTLSWPMQMCWWVSLQEVSGLQIDREIRITEAIRKSKNIIKKEKEKKEAIRKYTFPYEHEVLLQNLTLLLSF